jgi:hypothetical protein
MDDDADLEAEIEQELEREEQVRAVRNAEAVQRRRMLLEVMNIYNVYLWPIKRCRIIRAINHFQSLTSVRLIVAQ